MKTSESKREEADICTNFFSQETKSEGWNLGIWKQGTL